MEKVDIVIIGAGVVGLAIARELAEDTGRTVVILEKNDKFGLETSSRNSGVIHSGIYYPSTMLKTSLCIEGNALLYDYCARHSIPHRRCGKVVISQGGSESQLLSALQEQAGHNGVATTWMNQQEVLALEPAIHAAEALLVPSTGIIDVYALMRSLYQQATLNHAVFVFRSEVQDLGQVGNEYIVETNREQIRAEVVINAAGLSAPGLLQGLGFDLEACAYRMYPCKGEYFQIPQRYSVSHLVYPLPGLHSLGIHLTIDTAGGLRLGPNAVYGDQLDYSVDESHGDQFYQAAQRYLPDLERKDISPDFSGIRPKLQPPDDPSQRDFVIQHESHRGFPGLINLIGIESPGLTSCLAIARYVHRIVQGI